MGFLATDGRTLVDVKKCLLAADDVNAKLTYLRSRPRPRQGLDGVFEQSVGIEKHVKFYQ